MVTMTFVTPRLSSAASRRPGKVHPGCAAAGDLDIAESDGPPPHAQALHDGFLAGKPSGKPGRGIGVAVGVRPLVLREAPFPETLPVNAQEPPYAADLGEVDPEPFDIHDPSVPSHVAVSGTPIRSGATGPLRMLLSLLHRHTLGEVSGLVDIVATEAGYVVCQ